MGSGKFGIARDQRRIERLGKCDVRGNVDRDRVPQRPDAAQRRQVGMSHNAQSLKIAERLAGQCLHQRLGADEATQYLGDLNVEKMRRMNGLARVKHAVGDPGCPRDPGGIGAPGEIRTPDPLARRLGRHMQGLGNQ